MAKDRLTWDEYFMNLAITVSERGTCDRAYVGCVIVNEDNRIVTTGYNGSIKGNPHCDDIGHTMRDGHCIATIHAEMNALLYCAKEGISVKRMQGLCDPFSLLKLYKKFNPSWY